MVVRGYGERCAKRGHCVGHERVRRLMLVEGLKPVYRRAYRVTTDSDHPHPVAPNVLERCFEQQRTDRAWVSDITYIPMAEGWLYLAVVLDLASRRIIGWSMSAGMAATLVRDAMAMAFFRRRPLAGVIAHSDRGVQYASASQQPAQAVSDDPVDEPQGELLGQRTDGKLLQDTQSRTCVSTSL